MRLGRRADRREVLGGVGLAQRAADRAAVAHHRVGDDLLGVAEQREVLGQQVGLEQVDVARERADLDHRRPPRGCRRARARSLMSIRCSGWASRSFIIGSRLWPPAMIRASGPSRSSEAIAPVDAGRTLVLEWRGGLHGAPLLRQDCLAGNCLRGWPMSSRRSYCSGESVPMTGERGSSAAPVLAARRVQHRATPRCRRRDRAAPAPRGLAAAIGASRPSRASVSVPSRVDLADPRRHDVLALREVAQARGGGARVEALDRGRRRRACRPS